MASIHANFHQECFETSLYGLPRNRLIAYLQRLPIEHITTYSPMGQSLILDCFTETGKGDYDGDGPIAGDDGMVPYPPTWKLAFDRLYAYYLKSPMEFATQFIQSLASLTAAEFDRLCFEGSHEERAYLQDRLSDKIPRLTELLASINNRLQISLSSHDASLKICK